MRCVAGAWLFACVVLYTLYSAHLTASLTVTKYTLPFNTLEEMIAHPDYSFGVSSGNGLRQVFGVGHFKLAPTFSSLHILHIVLTSGYSSKNGLDQVMYRS